MQIIKNAKKLLFGVAMVGAATLAPVLGAAAQQTLTSPSYTIDASVINSFGGTSDSANYSMVSSGGEPVAGSTSSTSYSLGEGYVSQLESTTSGVTDRLKIYVHNNTLQHQWGLDSTTGTTAYDNTDNAQDMTLTNGPTWTTGKLDGALQFDGSNDYAGKSSVVGISSTSGISVSAWVKLDRLNVKQVVFSHAEGIDSGSPDGWQLGVGTDNKPYFKACNGTTCATSTVNSTMTTGTWYRVTGRVTGSSPYNVTARLNKTGGTAVALNSIMSFGANRQLSLGAQLNYGGATTNYLQGAIDQVSYYSAYQHPDVVDNEYDAQNAGATDALNWRNLTPGVSVTNELEWLVETDAANGYTVGVSQDHDLQYGIYSIPAVSSGSIGTPALWTEGTTTGTGFTLEASPGSPISPNTTTWGSDPNFKYAAFPNTVTTFFTKNTAQSGVEWMDMLVRIDPPITAAASVVGATENYYSNTVTFTGTTLP